MTDEPQTNIDPIPERARIEPSPTAKRLDALPVLYLVGFVILASALIYLWQHPTLPRSAAVEAARVDTMREQIDTLAGQVKGLEARAIPEVAPLEARLATLEHRPEVASSLAPGVLAPLEARVAALEGRPLPPPVDLRPLDDRIGALEKRAPVDLKPLDGRIGALEARPPVDLKPMEGRIAALEERPPVDLRPLAARISAVEARPLIDLGPLGERVDAQAKKQAADMAALSTQLGARLDGLEASGKQGAAGLTALGAQLAGRLDGLEASEKQNASGLAALVERAQLSGRLQAMSVALAAGQRLGDVPGAPPALARFAHDTPPTEAGLRLSFDQAATAAHDASQPAIAGDKPFLDRVWARAQQSVTVRQGDKVLVGDPIGGVIEAARKALDAGDLQGAVTALEPLAGPAKAAMAGWIGQAQSLLDARAAIGALASRG